jgi:hypothetical protein
MLLWEVPTETIVLIACKKLRFKTKALVHITAKLSCVLLKQAKYLGVANVILKYFPWHSPIKTYGFHNSADTLNITDEGKFTDTNRRPDSKVLPPAQTSASFIFKRMYSLNSGVN